MKTIILTSTLLLLIFSYSNAQVNKKVLLEESSYATCRNCPEGAVWMDSIITEFPNVICVSHNIYADAVTIPSNFNENQIRIVAFVSYYNAGISQREVLNVNIINLDELSPTFTNDLSQNKHSVFIYPQPFSDLKTLNFGNSKNESHTLLLYDVQGRLVKAVTKGNRKSCHTGRYIEQTGTFE